MAKDEELLVDFFEQEVEEDEDKDKDLDHEDLDEEKDLDKDKKDEEDEDSDNSDKDEDEDEDSNKDKKDEDEDEDEEDGDDEPQPLVDEIRERLGYEVDGEFEDSEEGLQLLVEKVSEKRSEELIDQYFDQFPDVKEYVEYRNMGGDPDKYFKTKFPEVDYSEVELDSEDETQQERIVRRELTEVRGYTPEEVEAELEDYRNGGILKNKAERALSALKAKQQKDKDSLLEEQRKEQEAYEEQVEEHWENVETTIKENTSFKGFKIPSSDKDPFLEYLSKPVEDGKSKAILAHEKADLETKLAIDYLLYKGFDLAGLIERKAKDKNAESLRKRMRQAKLDKKSEESVDGDSALLEELGEI